MESSLTSKENIAWWQDAVEHWKNQVERWREMVKQSPTNEKRLKFMQDAEASLIAAQSHLNDLLFIKKFSDAKAA